MKIVGLITEYNPFHNGHLYHIEKAKEATGADAVIAVMSGDFVQRGAPAVMSKHLRAKAALESGVDVVLELPVCYAAGSAEYFARGAIALLDALGCVDAVCFGSECGDITLLEQIAHILADEPEEYKAVLQDSLRMGMSFPLARQKALEQYWCKCKSETGNIDSKERFPETLLEEPNNILGIEYLKSLYASHSTINAYTIRRKDSGYHDEYLADTYSSASAIRKELENSSCIPELLRNQMPPASIRILEDAYKKSFPICADDFSLLLKYKLLAESRDTLTNYSDVNEDLANRILNHINDFRTFGQFCGLLKTRNTTYSHISRSLIHVLLNITDHEPSYLHNEHLHNEHLHNEIFCHYAHILGFRRDTSKVLACLKQNSRVPLITKLTKTEGLSDAGQQMLEQDIFAADLYESVAADKFQTPFINEYLQQVIRV